MARRACVGVASMDLSLTHSSPLELGPGVATMAPNVPMLDSATSHRTPPCPVHRRPFRSTSRLPRPARSSACRPAPCGAQLPTSSFVRTTSDDWCESNLPSFGAGSRRMGLRRQRPKASPFAAPRAADRCLPLGSPPDDGWSLADAVSFGLPRRSSARVHRAGGCARARARARVRAGPSIGQQSTGTPP
jgi:hypothetical protein